MEVVRFYPKRHLPKVEKATVVKESVRLRTMEERMGGIFACHAKNVETIDRLKAEARVHTRKQMRDYMRRRKEDDPAFRLLCTLRSRVQNALRGKKQFRTLQLVGCSIASLRDYLEMQFQAGMTWENHGEWEIDHIRPCASFDLTCRKQQRECFHFSNLQPLWKADNRIKSDKWTPNL